MAPDLEGSRCTECGAQVPEEFSSCDELFMSILVPLYIDHQESADLAALARLIVDTFAMQHPERGCRSAKSYAAHLTGLCCGLEYNGAESVYAALQRWLNGPVEAIGIARPTEPDCRGALTIRYVHDALTEAELIARTREWAEDVWEAYSSQHEIAREWIRKTIGAESRAARRKIRGAG